MTEEEEKDKESFFFSDLKCRRCKKRHAILRWADYANASQKLIMLEECQYCKYKTWMEIVTP